MKKRLQSFSASFKKTFARRLKNESGQGSAEYIILIGIIVVALLALGPRIREAITNKANSVGSQIESSSF